MAKYLLKSLDAKFSSKNLKPQISRSLYLLVFGLLLISFTLDKGDEKILGHEDGQNTNNLIADSNEFESAIGVIKVSDNELFIDDEGAACKLSLIHISEPTRPY